MEQNNDEELIGSYLEGDEKSLEILIRRYLKPIYNFTVRLIGNKEDADDLVQEIFVKVWNSLKKFDKSRKFKTWLYRIARNSAIDHLRKKKVLTFSDLNNEDESLTSNLVDENPLADDLLIKKDLEKEIDEALKKVPLNYRTVIWLYYNDSLNFREISEILGESENTIKSRHRRAIGMLRKILINQNNISP